MAYNVDISLIKINRNYYYEYKGKIVKKIVYKGRTFFDKYEKIDEPLTFQVMNDHIERKRIIAHDLINRQRNIVENIVFDYNGNNPEIFWNRASLLLREEGFLNFTAYNSKTPGHLHLYIHKGHTTLNEGIQIAKKLSLKLAGKLPKQWRVFPTDELPPEFNILNLPYELYKKERGASWARHM
ncbi:DUF1882 domain-containing protein [Lebetimonas natsushimae]|uniref:DUF1882 domain-containing protein n=1 Tax=Lebetimonas natsushimae TaxID=1936991 RepID=UPI000BB6CC47|nr:DUF1882 domain-containing protein [Lebetimonas natsushimae]